MNTRENFYVRKKEYWLKFFKKFLNNKKVNKLVLQKYFAPEKIPELKVKVLQEFEDLLPQVPDFGNTKVDRYSTDMIKNTQSLAFYRVLKSEGYPLRMIGQIMFEIAEVYYSNINPFVKYLIRAQSLSPSYINKYKKSIEERNRGYVDPDDYHCEFVEGDQQNLLFGLNYTNCAASQFLRKQNATELHPYLCVCDYPMFRAFNVGFNREQNIAAGGSMCAFRVYRNYPTPIGWPPEDLPEYKDYKFS